MRRMELIGLLLLALILGLLIAWVDTRPHWDDTGVTVGLIIVVCMLFGAARPKQPWFWALAVGLWIPGLNIARYHNYGSVIALVFAFAGAYAGAYGRRLLTQAGNPV